MLPNRVSSSFTVARLLGSPANTTATRYLPSLMSSPATPGPRGVEDGDDRHAVDDLARKDHPLDLPERERTNLDELGLVRGQREVHEVLTHEQMSGFVHHALARVVRRDRRQPARAVADLLQQLALGRPLDGLSGVDPTRRHLPGRSACDVAILLDEKHGLRIEEREHADALPAAHHAVDRRAAVRELHDVLTEGEPAILVDRSRGESLPWNLGEPAHFVCSSSNPRVCRGSSPADPASVARSRARSLAVSMSYQHGRQATRRPFASARRIVSERTVLVLQAIVSNSSR